ncbi:N-acetylmannosamine-6-phosphate 2-epimerase [Sinomonas humi]|uniref:N-acetylmannosamine-6-phosphate 2-epimerase n=1 Tax=Sinomonas humi TaxID=1338436 RepID=UPI000690983F|nr:putative N-acetylmannosamine-6-phosphate 2-epimerase [Sinomonas humi]
MDKEFGLRRGVIISCQAPEDSPLRDPHVMARMAQAAEKAGAVAIRAEGALDIAAIRASCSLPIIGIRKHHYPDSEVYITATRHDVDLVADAGAEIVALDATDRPRPGGESLTDVIAHAKARGLTVMADLSHPHQGASALEAGADILATTLVPESGEDVRPHGPNLAALKALVEAHPGYLVIGEGRYATPSDIADGLGTGALAIVVGRAVTDTYALTTDLVRAAERAHIVG